MAAARQLGDLFLVVVGVEAADQVLGEAELVAVVRGHGVEHVDRDGGDLGADAVAGQGDDMGFHAFDSGLLGDGWNASFFLNAIPAFAGVT